MNEMLMEPDGSLLPSKSKSDLIHCLEYLVSTEENTESGRAIAPNRCYLVIDGMAVVQALMHAVKFETCKELGKAFTQRIDGLLVNYEGGRIIFDNYRKQLSIKDQIRYGSSTDTSDDLNINDATPIKDTTKFLTSKNNKDQLTVFLADKAINECKKPVVTATRQHVLSNTRHKPTTGVSTQEEADTLMMPHALELVNFATDVDVDFYTQDTDWFVIIFGDSRN